MKATPRQPCGQIANCPDRRKGIRRQDHIRYDIRTLTAGEDVNEDRILDLESRMEGQAGFSMAVLVGWHWLHVSGKDAGDDFTHL